MRKLITGALVAASVIALGAPPAVAAGGWTVINPDPLGRFSASLHTDTGASFTDVATNQPFTCAASTLSGHWPSGTGLSGFGIATFENGTFTDCGTLQGSGSASLTGQLNLFSYDSAADTAGGDAAGIQANLEINSILGTCSATLSGQVGNVTYNNNGTLAFAPFEPGLVIQSTQGSCAGLINAGDGVAFRATYDVTPVITVRPDDASPGLRSIG